MADIVAPVLDWYRQAARDLPWRAADASPWAVLVSEVMLQQTPVNRVLPIFTSWVSRWPSPSALAADSPGDAVRAWGKLGYPRRALRLHECAVAIVTRHAGTVPCDVDALLALPGVGSYTARAVAAFAFGQRQAVVDTNVRRVLARAVLAQALPGPPSTARDLRAAEALLPTQAAVSARFSVALMELGALVCIARRPRCAGCPIRDQCAWRQAGSPPYDGPAAASQRFAGTDRQVRGLLMDALRATAGPVSRAQLDLAWHDDVQRARALDGLVDDGLAEPMPGDCFALRR